MFDLKQIQAAHAKVKSGTDFPNYIQDLIKLGILSYDTYVSDGHTIFIGSKQCQVLSEPKYPELPIAHSSDKEKFKHFLKIHQQGETDYPTFCKHAAETGVEKWRVDMSALTCTYYGKSNDKMLEEHITQSK